MKQPTPEQREQMRMLRQYNRFVEYLNTLEEDYVERMLQENDEVQMRRAQGSLYTIRKMKQLITE